MPRKLKLGARMGPPLGPAAAVGGTPIPCAEVDSLGGSMTEYFVGSPRFIAIAFNSTVGVTFTEISKENV